MSLHSFGDSPLEEGGGRVMLPLMNSVNNYKRASSTTQKLCGGFCLSLCCKLPGGCRTQMHSVVTSPHHKSPDDSHVPRLSARLPACPRARAWGLPPKLTNSGLIRWLRHKRWLCFHQIRQPEKCSFPMSSAQHWKTLWLSVGGNPSPSVEGFNRPFLKNKIKTTCYFISLNLSWLVFPFAAWLRGVWQGAKRVKQVQRGRVPSSQLWK